MKIKVDLLSTLRALSNSDRLALISELGRRGESSIIDLAERTSLTRFACIATSHDPRGGRRCRAPLGRGKQAPQSAAWRA
jgi:hypothetical protein